MSETDENIFSAPLTLFYAINNFSKAIIYATYPNETVAGSHGIDLANTKEEIENFSELGKIQVIVNSKGAFSSLLKLTGDNIQPGTIFSLEDGFICS